MPELTLLSPQEVENLCSDSASAEAITLSPATASALAGRSDLDTSHLHYCEWLYGYPTGPTRLRFSTRPDGTGQIIDAFYDGGHLVRLQLMGHRGARNDLPALEFAVRSYQCAGG